MNILVRWVAAAVIATGLLGTLYVVMQQSERQGADDTPQRIASQVAAQLSQSTPVTTSERVDLAVSDAAFFVVYDTGNHPVAGTGRLGGTLPTPPAGVLDAARRAGANHVTWQTPDGRRFATVERRAGDEVVLAGQSLTPTEARVDQLGLLVLVSWVCVLAVIVAAFLIERASDASRRGTRG